MSSKVPLSLKPKSAFSCSQCRSRKVKCGGEQPACRRCIARKDSCLYKLNPTLTYTEKLEKRIKELESMVSNLKSRAGEASENSEHPQRLDIGEELGNSPQTSEGGNRTSGLRVDDQGKITYHGATSFFLPLTSSTTQTSNQERSVSSFDDEIGGDRKERLINNAWMQRVLENLSETPEPFQFMLKAHWCWIQPLFNFVYRPAFTRDMDLLGPYYSHTLLNAMMSHSVRWCKNNAQIKQLLVPYENGLLFSEQARSLVFEEVRVGNSKIPTVQTLLLLSAQECSKGNRTQAWLYSGMAFRLIEDMGVCIDGQKFAGSVRLSDEDIEIRHRLFWSCYFWDKMISLYLGRSPTLQHSAVSPPQIMLDDSAETELWTPHGLEYPPGMEYIPMQAHSITCFMRMCRLVEIFNQILVHVYDPLQQNTNEEIQNSLKVEGTALEAWWDDLPEFLRIDAQNLPFHCPPSHIATLNCLFHTFKILLYRSMLFQRTSEISGKKIPNPQHLVQCISSANSIIAIFDLFCRTFGDAFCVLSLSYSVFTAASIFLLQIQAAQPPDELALRRLEFCISALERVKSANPVMEQCVASITQELSKMGIQVPLSSDGQNLHSSEGSIENATPLNNILQHSIIEGQNPTDDVSHAIDLPPLEYFDPSDVHISPEFMEAFSFLEPIDHTVGIL